MDYKKISWGRNSIGGLSDIVGKTPIKIEVDERMGDDHIVMWFNDDTVCRFYHEQDCCESVEICDINGDFKDLIGYPILVDDERVSKDVDADVWESNTWTFYTFRSIGGSVDVRWFGSSNGYYSEYVYFQMVRAQ